MFKAHHGNHVNELYFVDLIPSNNGQEYVATVLKICLFSDSRSSLLLSD